MKAIVIVPGTSTLRLEDRAEPFITAPDEIKLRVLRVGICGTDREEASGGRARAPDGQKGLIIGHEMFGQVVEVGHAVSRVQTGDYAVFTVRRGCGQCLLCAMNRSDMCRTGNYHERGIWGLDGYQAEYVVDKEQYVVRVPRELEPLGVLIEPLSIAEKAIDEAVRLQMARLPDTLATPQWLFDRRCLVAGLGPIGLLAAMALRLREAEVYGLDIVDASTARPQWLAAIGGHYVDGRQIPPDQVDDALGPMDLIFEATGVPGLAFNLLDALALNGVYVLTGIPGGSRPLQIPGAELIRQFVLDNQVMVGSVNAARDHFQMAVDDLAQAHLCWSDHVARLITHRYPTADFAMALGQHPPDEIKAVIQWTAV
ncbi:MAG: glucose 1-dehydrogenase [Acidobacteria bacterium]|nr:glucose 1-dehydrogenase [Acidobacteriota bacterium]